MNTRRPAGLDEYASRVLDGTGVVLDAATWRPQPDLDDRTESAAPGSVRAVVLAGWHSPSVTEAATHDGRNATAHDNNDTHNDDADRETTR